MMTLRWYSLLFALLIGAPLISGTGSAAATPTVGENPPWGVNVYLQYKLPADTKVEWFYVNQSGNCFMPLTDSQVHWVDTVVYPEIKRFHSMFTTYTSAIDRCGWQKSYGTWQVRITTPDHVVKTGSLYFTTGSPNIWIHYGEVSCHDFSYFTCIADSDTVVPPFDKSPTLYLTLGPITTGTVGGGGSVAFGS